MQTQPRGTKTRYATCRKQDLKDSMCDDSILINFLEKAKLWRRKQVCGRTSLAADSWGQMGGGDVCSNTRWWGLLHNCTRLHKKSLNSTFKMGWTAQNIKCTSMKLLKETKDKWIFTNTNHTSHTRQSLRWQHAGDSWWRESLAIHSYLSEFSNCLVRGLLHTLKNH